MVAEIQHADEIHRREVARPLSLPQWIRVEKSATQVTTIFAERRGRELDHGLLLELVTDLAPRRRRDVMGLVNEEVCELTEECHSNLC